MCGPPEILSGSFLQSNPVQKAVCAVRYWDSFQLFTADLIGFTSISRNADEYSKICFLSDSRNIVPLLRFRLARELFLGSACPTAPSIHGSGSCAPRLPDQAVLNAAILSLVKTCASSHRFGKQASELVKIVLGIEEDSCLSI